MFSIQTVLPISRAFTVKLMAIFVSVLAAGLDDCYHLRAFGEYGQLMQCQIGKVVFERKSTFCPAEPHCN